MQNRAFVIIEEYDNIPNSEDLIMAINKFAPRISFNEFSTFSGTSIKSLLSNDFFQSNHVDIMSTNDKKRIDALKQEHPDCIWHKREFKYSSDNFLEVHYCLTRKLEKNILIVCLYLNNYYIKKQAFTYARPVGKKINT